MKFTVEDERKLVMNDPTLAEFRNNLQAKPNGDMMLEEYIKGRVQRKNQEAWFEGVDKDNPRYNDYKDMVNRRRQVEVDTEAELGAPPTTLQRTVNATGIITNDWWDKAKDVVTRVLSNPEDTTKQPSDSQKPSLWDVFWK